MVSGAPAIATVSTTTVCDPDAAYDPTTACVPPSNGNSIRQEALAAPSRMMTPGVLASRPSQAALQSEDRMVAVSVPIHGSWAVQVGAFSTSVTARLAAERARGVAPAVLQRARVELHPTAPFGSTVLYRARLTGLSADEASGACAYLVRSRLECIVVRPGREHES